MQDDEITSDATNPTPTTPPPNDQPSPDDQPSAELSRAAREAVRQPPDPRLEKQFAYLGLWGESEPEATPARRSDDAAANGAEVARIHEALAALEVGSRKLNDRLDGVLSVLSTVARLLAVLIVVVLGLAILVLARSLG